MLTDVYESEPRRLRPVQCYIKAYSCNVHYKNAIHTKETFTQYLGFCGIRTLPGPQTEPPNEYALHTIDWHFICVV